jgi:signal transduction histidine kinase/PAS domain-containing protein
MNAPLPNNETLRLEALRQYNILDTLPEQAFDDFTALAAQICETPIALITLVDARRQWFKSKVGFTVTETPRDIAFCAHTILKQDVFVVRDASVDERFSSNPLVTAAPYIRFYAGVPLIAPQGYALGTLCVIDSVPRELNPKQLEALQALSRQVMAQLELRKTLAELIQAKQESEQAEQERLQLLQREQAARNQITQILESITDAFFALNNEWQFTYLNQQAERLQRKREELLGRCVWDEFPETLGSLFYQEYHRAVAEQVSVEFEAFYPPLNTWFSVHAYPREQGLSVYFQNINARKQTEKALLETTQLQRAILDSANYTIISTTSDGTIRTFNAAAERLLGYTSSEVVGKVTPVIIHDRAEVIERSRQLTEELGIPIEPGFASFIAKARLGVPDEREWTYIRKDGSRFPVLLSITALRDLEGNITGFLGIGSDITQRKQVEETLQRQNRRSQLFTEITLKIRQSLRLEEILQTTVTEIQNILQVDRVLLYRVWPNGTGSTVTEAVQPGWPAVLGMSFNEEVFPLEYQELYRQGQVRAIADVEQAYAEVTPCLLEFLQPWGVKAKLIVPILMTEDWGEQDVNIQNALTQFKTQNSKLKTQNSNSQSPRLWGLLIAHHCSSPRQWTSFEIELLQQLSEQIGLALTQAQLLERETRQRQELARSNAQLQEFAYVASHDLQEPLRKIRAFGDRLRVKYSEVLTDRGCDYLTRMQNAAERMQALIDDLLALSRVTTRAQPFVSTNLAQVVHDVLCDLEVRIQQTGGRIEVGELPTLDADPVQMRQLLQNLISNALKFHRAEEPPMIKIYSQLLLDQKWQPAEEINRATACQIFIEDNGIGFDEKYLDRIFNAFQRLHGRSEYEGTGMGLAICRKIVERHNGKITAQSLIGHGSLFIITLPLQQSQGKAEEFTAKQKPFV